MPSASCSLPGCGVVISAEAAAAQSLTGRGLHGGVWDAMRWGCNSGLRRNREMGRGGVGGEGDGVKLRTFWHRNV